MKSLIASFRLKPYRNIFFLLLLAILIDAVAPSAVARGRFSDLMLAVALLIAMVETVRTNHHAKWALALGLPAVVSRIVVAFMPDTTVRNTAVLFLSAVFMGFLIWVLLHDLATKDRPTDERIYGALVAYVFIGLFFALVYTHMEYRQPGTFTTSNQRIAEEASIEANLFPALTYFSFVTLTTLGYGDITPVAEHARTLAWFEALMGQLYLAVMVAGFVAAHISQNINKKRDEPPADPDG